MVRMILAQPRSRSNLLGSAYPGYVNELFTPGWIQTTTFFKENRDLLKYGSGPGDQFAAAYAKHLRQTMHPNMDFTFKVHYCGIKDWPEAQELIEYWNPTEIIGCHRSNKKASVMSTLLADKHGYTSFHDLPHTPFRVTKEQFDYAFERCVIDWYAGLEVYTPTEWYEYDTIPAHICSRFNWDDARYRAFLAECRYKDLRSEQRLNKILNLDQVEEWWQTSIRNLA